jgi:purine-nucleoside phosphorylase
MNERAPVDGRLAPSIRAVREWLGGRDPRAALVLGSGLAAFTQRLQDVRRLSFTNIPAFPGVHVAGHVGELVAGRLGQSWLLCQSGRFHGYEGHSAEIVALPMRLFAALGIERVILTNAAGGIATGLEAGSLMLITDQINLTFANPLHGPVRPGEPRFPDMSAPFDPRLIRIAIECARQGGIGLARGVYAGVTGPSYETPAEIRMLRTLGADVVGMSTVLETIAARAAGMRCLGISVVTNRAAGLGSGRLSHQEVLTASAAAAKDLEQLVTRIVNYDERSGAASMAGTL